MVQTDKTLKTHWILCDLPHGVQAGVLGPTKPVRYPLSEGTLLFLVTVSLLPIQPWWPSGLVCVKFK